MHTKSICDDCDKVCRLYQTTKNKNKQLGFDFNLSVKILCVRGEAVAVVMKLLDKGVELLEKV